MNALSSAFRVTNICKCDCFLMIIWISSKINHSASPLLLDSHRSYAQKNRKEWERKGQELVDAMVEKFKDKYADASGSEQGVEVVIS